MKCISLWQPWASYMADGEKRIETRHWPTRYRGPLLIHAAKTQEHCSSSQRAAIPFGAIICRVELIDCVSAEKLREIISSQEEALGNYGDGRFGWVTANLVKFEVPIPYRGQQGLFDVPDELIPKSDTTG